MKVLGIARDRHDRVYICEIRHDEIEKFLNRYRVGKADSLGELKPGDDVDLGAAYDFAHQARTAMQKTQDMIEANAKIIEAIVGGIRILDLKPKGDD